MIVENNGSLIADEMVIVPEAAMKCAFGENPRDFGRKGKQPNTRASVAFLLRKCLQDAIDYKLKGERPKENEPFKKIWVWRRWYVIDAKFQSRHIATDPMTFVPRFGFVKNSV